MMDSQPSGHGRVNRSAIPLSADIFEPSSMSNAKHRTSMIEWMNSVLPSLCLPVNASDEELRVFLVDGFVLCQLLNKLKPGSVPEYASSAKSATIIEKFLSAMDEMRLPRFQKVDLEKGSMKIVLDCLLTLKTHFMSITMKEHLSQVDSSDERRKTTPDTKFQQPFTTPSYRAGHNHQEVFQPKQGCYPPASNISEMSKSNNFDSASTQSLLTVVNGILDNSVECKTGEMPQRMSSLLRQVVQEIERRIYTQNEHLKMQNSTFRAREEKYKSRIKVLEALGEETKSKIVMQTEPTKIEEKNKVLEQDVVRLMKEKDEQSQAITALEKELEVARKTNEKHMEDKHSQEIAALKQELEEARKTNERNTKDEHSQEIEALKQELEARKRNEKNTKDEHSHENAALKKELQVAKETYEQQLLQVEKDAREVQHKFEERLKEVSNNLTESRSKVKELETSSGSISERWNKKQHIYHIFTDFQLGALRELRFSSQSIRQDVVKTQKSYSQEFNQLEKQIRELQDAAQNYYVVLGENRKLHNELQELKGNIRVYCRIRPFSPKEKDKNSTIEYVGDNGELVVVNPAKSGKEGRKMFKFNKVYGPTSTQGEVFSDIQPFIQSVLDGFNVCIFAYGPTGSGKTYTMMGPNGAREEQWGVNHRTLNDLFRISKSRETTFTYEISVQMVEIYNEKVRDLLSIDSSQKKYPFKFYFFVLLNLHTLGILSNSQSSGLTVPDAIMFPVKSTSDVLELMDAGMKNAAKSATALNERSSRSHSVLTIHVRGTDLKTNSSMRSSLHLVDLAGSERVDRSEVTGDRLKEAQHINKSLSALGDVIFALSQKNSHIPYRNSKLTQVLQSSLGNSLSLSSSLRPVCLIRTRKYVLLYEILFLPVMS
ncbi:microtubule binding motor protein [Lithospermum erythrorhizon]|uniref:Kinesin-like protein n=1 Tax=Lithospermum erythrorhizon TaxID=34254 RepID=A0AAV3PMV7_LITER